MNERVEGTTINSARLNNIYNKKELIERIKGSFKWIRAGFAAIIGLVVVVVIIHNLIVTPDQRKTLPAAEIKTLLAFVSQQSIIPNKEIITLINLLRQSPAKIGAITNKEWHNETSYSPN